MSPIAPMLLMFSLVIGEWLVVVGGVVLLIRRADRL